MQIFGTCNRYIQGFRELDNLKKHTEWMGNRFLIIASKNRLALLKDRIIKAMGGEDNLVFCQFGGKCTWQEINRLKDIAASSHVSGVIGIGGGAIADTSNAVANFNKVPIVIVPTTASCDAFTSCSTLVYEENSDSQFEALKFPKNPELVLVDTEIIINAPVRQLVAGMGDALSTYIGAKVCYENHFLNHFRGYQTLTGYAIAKLSYEILLKYGKQAKIAAERKSMTDALNKIIEVNILMSGAGFENNGSASDHCFHFGTEALKTREHYVLHGEGVAFSTCCQLVMQGSENNELHDVFNFCYEVGLPITFDDLHLPNLTEEEFDVITMTVLAKPFIKNHPFEVTYEMVHGAYKAADAIGRLYKSGGKLV
jgi:glycerol dehydrogenase